MSQSDGKLESGENKIICRNYSFFLYQESFKQNPTGEIIFEQKDKVLLFSGIYSNPEYPLAHNLV